MAVDRDGKTVANGAEVVMAGKVRRISGTRLLVVQDRQLIQAEATDVMLATTLDVLKHHNRHNMGVLNFGNPVSAVTLLVDDYVNGLASSTYRIPIERNVTAEKIAIRALTFTATPPTDWVLTLYKNGTAVGTKGFTIGTNPTWATTFGNWSVVGGQNLDFNGGAEFHMQAAGTGVNAIGIICESGWVVRP